MERFTTPVAPCLYPFLQKPKVDPNGEYPSIYQITLVLDKANKEHGELLQHISNLHKESKGSEDKKPIKKHTDAEGKETGLYTIRFKCKAEFLPWVPTYDAQGTPDHRPENYVANDSKVRVNWSYGFYKQGGGGVSLYLNGVQIIDLIEWKGLSAEAMGFDKVDGYVKDTTPKEFESTAESNINAPSQTAEPSDTDEDVPF